MCSTIGCHLGGSPLLNGFLWRSKQNYGSGTGIVRRPEMMMMTVTIREQGNGSLHPMSRPWSINSNDCSRPVSCLTIHWARIEGRPRCYKTMRAMHVAISAALYICTVALAVCATPLARSLIVLCRIPPKEVILQS